MEVTEAQLHDYDLEEAVLGACMLEKDALDSIQNWDDEVFYKPQHQAIAYAITMLVKQDKPVDIATVCQMLDTTGRLQDAGGRYTVVQMTNRVSSSLNTSYHYHILYQYRLLRQLSEMGFSLKNEVYKHQADPFEIINQYTGKLEGLTAKLASFNINQLHKLSDQNLTRIRSVIDSGIIPGVRTSCRKVTRKTGGWQKTDLIIIAARPGMGKTGFALGEAIEAAKEDGDPIAIFSLEMSSQQLTGRAQSYLTGFSGENINRANLTKSDIDSIELTMRSFAALPIYIDDTPSISIYQLRHRARRLKKEKGIKMIIIDYLQLMTAEGFKGNREQEISYISRSLKALAKELDIPIIALSQLSRDVEKRPGTTKKPNLSDLRESGSIEQDADSVYFIYRPEYYGIDTFEDGSASQGMAELICGKNRHGSPATYRLGFNGRCTKFFDPEEQAEKDAEKNLQANINFEQQGNDIIS